MPKESIHFKIAKMLSSIYGFENESFKELAWSSILPDMFFYVPLPYFPRLGNRLHLFEREAFSLPAFVNKVESSSKMQLLGIILHLLADKLWHPDIEAASEKLTKLTGHKFSKVYFHRLIESYMQKFFMDLDEEDSFTKFINRPPSIKFAKQYGKALKFLLKYREIKIRIPSSYQVALGIKLHAKILMILQTKNIAPLVRYKTFPSWVYPLISLYPPTENELHIFLSKYRSIPEIQKIFSTQIFYKRFDLLVSSIPSSRELLKTLQRC